MKTIALLFFIVTASFAQSKSTPTISFNAGMSAKFTLDKATSMVTLVVIAPADKWTSLALGTCSSATAGDIYLYKTSVLENTNVSNNAKQDWNTVSNTVSSGVRTVTLERALTNSDLNDFQMAFDTTNTIDVVWSQSGPVMAAAPNPNRGVKTAVFGTHLATAEVSLLDEVSIYPNPSSNEVYISTKKNVSQINIYTQTGVLVNTIIPDGNANEQIIDVSDLATALYIFELETDSGKIWKKLIVN